eukprot:CAMPEP_0197637838 /NCGR_PEP_ID=MMETSP1338-20131121/12936_1 /TAXON_ID=43686 ORGANISM="Pelagodinium beii, Strain RCC1491" /NCGR_SAMPLE_ID=MMETSP1338 /ASSEMBLY_ACC=CAM_ASM_000754 /LENGTH=520 /DNA_ID=CAMNT_0043210315 /DNA_START=34 /DNA_END=1592 /DNA_ORIENTATION=-
MDKGEASKHQVQVITASTLVLTASAACAYLFWRRWSQAELVPIQLRWLLGSLLQARQVRLQGSESNSAERDEDRGPELEDLGDEPSAARQPWRLGVRRNQKQVAVEKLSQKGVPGTKSVFVKTYGCAHNNSDSEFMMGLLRDYGYTLADKLEDADAIVVNSCTVKGPSEDGAVKFVNNAKGAGKAVVMAGCVPTGDATLAKSMDGVSMLGVTQLDRVVEVVEETLEGHTVSLLGHRKTMPTLDLPKVRKNKYVEIIPISGGCLGNCSYCKTKHARGTLSSYTEEAIVARALQAVSEGVSEIWLTSEDTGAYGLDIGTNIASLLPKVADALPLTVMLKLGMTNPPYMLAHIDAVAEVLKRPNVFEFLHVPVQSGSDAVLRAMVREYTSEDFRRLVNGLREKVPGMAVATDVICGFPAEGEDDHQATLDLVKEFKFPILNIAQFYPRPGTAAARLKRLAGNVVKSRSTEMTRLFESYATWHHLVAREERVWFSDTDERYNQTVGHTKGYAKVVVPRDDLLLG